MHYTVVRTEYLNNLIDGVNEKIKEGYIPYENIVVNPKNGMFYQAMIKHDAVELKFFANEDF